MHGTYNQPENKRPLQQIANEKMRKKTTKQNEDGLCETNGKKS